MGIFSKNREEWVTLDVACALYNCAIVPLYDSLGAKSISYVLNHTNITTCFCDSKSLDTLLLTENTGQVKNIVALDALTEEQTKILNERHLKYFTYAEVLQAGEKSIKPHAISDPDDITGFSYTSGTTGELAAFHSTYTCTSCSPASNPPVPPARRRRLHPSPPALTHPPSHSAALSGNACVLLAGRMKRLAWI